MRATTILALVVLMLVSAMAVRAAERPSPGERPETGRTPTADATEAVDEQGSTDLARAKRPICFGRKATIGDRSGEIAPTAGSDVIVGDDGANEINLFDAGESGGIDRVCGGGGRDVIDYRAVDGTSSPVFASAGRGPDTLRGTDGDDQLFGGDGNDSLSGFRGANLLSGGEGDDFLASSGPDRLEGGPGNDDLRADDFSTDTPGRDIVNGGEGNDDILAQDGRRDVVNCGPGNDTALIDPGIDKVEGCEQVSPGT